MRLHPSLLLSICLLGACEKKDAAPGSHPPDIATTRSSLRAIDGEPSAMRRELSRRSERPKEDVLAAIDRLLLDRQAGRETSDQFAEVVRAIEEADPAAFNAIWEKLSKLPGNETSELRLAAILHPGSGEDPAVALRLARDLWRPLVSPEEWRVIFCSLLERGSPSIPQALEILGEVEPEEHALAVQFINVQNVSPQDLLAIKDAGHQLDPLATRVILQAMFSGQQPPDPFVARPSEDEVLTRLQTMKDIIAGLESHGTLAKGAGRMLLLAAGAEYAELFLSNVPPQERLAYLRMEGADRLIERIITDEYDGGTHSLEPVEKGGTPGYFFTPTGLTGNLPAEQLTTALGAWQRHDAPAAEAWFATNGGQFPVSRQDEIRVRFAENTDLWGERSDAMKWIEQITDPVLREKTAAMLKNYTLPDPFSR